MTESRVPPRDLQAEKSLLGSIMLNVSVIDDVMQIVKPEDFYHESHATIYTICLELYNKSKPVDAVSVAERLEKLKKLDQIPPNYLLEIIETVPHSAHARHYAGIIKERANLRNLINTCSQTIEQCYDSGQNSEEISEQHEKQIFSMNEENNNKTHEISMTMLDVLQEIDDRATGKKRGIKSGFQSLDQITEFPEGELIIVAARPSMGKTAFVCNVARNIAQRDIPVLFFSLEQSRTELAMRFLSIETRISVTRMRKNLITSDEKSLIIDHANAIGKLPVQIDDRCDINLMNIAATIRRTKRQNRLGIVIIDYLQLVTPEDKRVPREQQVAGMTRTLKKMAKENNIPIIVLCQMNRQIESQTNKEPQLSHLRESGAIEQDADQILFIHRPEFYDPADQPGKAMLKLGKNRNGETGKIMMGWDAPTMTFNDGGGCEDQTIEEFAASMEDYDWQQTYL